MDDATYVDVKGIRTRYFEAGDGPPLVLVHGGHFGLGGCAEDWELNFEDLARSFRVYALDKLGMGFTDNPGSDDDYLVDSQAWHLHEFMRALTIESAHLAGHSRGGYVVTRVALNNPEKVRSLVVIDSSSVTSPFNPVYSQWRNAAAGMEPRQAVHYLAAVNSYDDAHITQRLVDVGVEIQNLPKTAEAKNKMDGGLFDRFKADLLQRVEDTKREIKDGRISAPTLLLWGFNDPSATMERCGKPAIDLFFTSVPDCEMHIFNRAGHPCFREQPEAFARVLTDFIERRERSKARLVSGASP